MMVNFHYGRISPDSSDTVYILYIVYVVSVIFNVDYQLLWLICYVIFLKKDGLS